MTWCRPQCLPKISRFQFQKIDRRRNTRPTSPPAMLRLLFRKLPQVSPVLRLSLVSPLAADQSSPIQKPDASSRGFSSTSDSHLSTLMSYGVTEEQASTILAKFPLLRNCDLKNILKPKLDFLLNAGFTAADVAEVLTANPRLLTHNLERSIAPSVHFLKTILPSKDFLVRVLKFTNCPIIPKNEPNIKLLKAVGVPEDMIVRLLRYQPRVLARSEEEFTAAVERVKSLGLAPTSNKFWRAVGVLSYVSRSSFQRKVDLYRELGWSEEAVYAMFKRYPECMALADENIRAKMAYFMEKFGWGPELLTVNPVVLALSLDGRIIPRCAVIKLLVVKGLLRKNTVVPAKFVLSERKFFESYVRKYEKEVPEVVKAYEGKIAFQEWECLKDEEKSSSSRKS